MKYSRKETCSNTVDKCFSNVKITVQSVKVKG